MYQLRFYYSRHVLVLRTVEYWALLQLSKLTNPVCIDIAFGVLHILQILIGLILFVLKKQFFFAFVFFLNVFFLFYLFFICILYDYLVLNVT